jgi:hypothetical protein
MLFHVTAGFILTVIAARTNRSWLLAPAIVLACPIVRGTPIVALAAIPRLIQADISAYGPLAIRRSRPVMAEVGPNRG